MKNTFGTSVTVTLFGESHGPEIGAVIDGLAPGLTVDEAFIADRLTLRRPAGRIATARQEADAFRIVSGVFEGRTTGTPLTILIPNADTRSGDYQRGPARPGHADYTAYAKYHGFEDYRGGGHFSGRITAGLVAAAAVVIPALQAKGIFIGTHVARCAGIDDLPFSPDLAADIHRLNSLPFAVLDAERGGQMREAIEAAAACGDSVGGILETAVLGLPAGVGEPWFDTVESVLSHALFSVPAVKGVEFGSGFALADMKGSQANDPFRMAGGKPVTVTNRNGESVDEAFRRGAQKALDIANREKPDLIILQSRSPSCGAKQIYDGTFSGILIPGQGIFARMAEEAGFKVMDAEDAVKEGIVL